MRRELVLDHSAEASHAFLAALVCEAAKDRKKPRVWLVCDIPRHRERLAAEMDLWGINALILPDPPTETGDGTIADPESAAEWFSVLEILARSETCAVLCGSDSFSGKAPSPAALRSSRTSLKPGTSLDPDDLAKSLANHGYERVPTVTARGQFAVRGGIIDLFAWQAAKPLRLEFFDTDLESIREFDLDSQSSTTKLLEADLLLAEPATESTVAEYRRKNDLIISFDAEIEKPDVRILEGAAEFNSEEDFTLATYGSPLGTFEAGDFVLEELRREHFFRQLNDWKRDDWDVAMVFSNKGEQERFLRTRRQGSRTRPRPHPDPRRAHGRLHTAGHQTRCPLLVRTLRPLPHARHRTPQHTRQSPSSPRTHHHR